MVRSAPLTAFTARCAVALSPHSPHSPHSPFTSVVTTNPSRDGERRAEDRARRVRGVRRLRRRRIHTARRIHRPLRSGFVSSFPSLPSLAFHLRRHDEPNTGRRTESRRSSEASEGSQAIEAAAQSRRTPHPTPDARRPTRIKKRHPSVSFIKPSIHPTVIPVPARGPGSESSSDTERSHNANSRSSRESSRRLRRSRAPGSGC